MCSCYAGIGEEEKMIQQAKRTEMEERIDEAQEDVVALRSNVELAEEVGGG